MDAEANAGSNGLLGLLTDRALPLARRGYDREATDSLLGQLEEGLTGILRHNQEALLRVRDLEERIAEGQEREEAVTQALVLATQIRADSEREGQELKDRCALEAEAITTEARRRAEEIREQAETDGRSIIEDAQHEASVLDQWIHDAEELAQRIQSHLRSFLQSMLDEVERRNEESVSIVGDLISRAGQTRQAEQELAVAPGQVAQDGARAGESAPPHDPS